MRSKVKRAWRLGRHGACRLHNRSMVRGVWNLEDLDVLVGLDVLEDLERLELRDGMKCRLYGENFVDGQTGLAARTTRGLDTVFLFSPLDFLSRRRLERLFHSLRQTQCFAPAFASRLHNRSILRTGEGF